MSSHYGFLTWNVSISSSFDSNTEFGARNDNTVANTARPSNYWLPNAFPIDCPCGLGACVNIINAHAAHFSISLLPLTDSTDFIPPVRVLLALLAPCDIL